MLKRTKKAIVTLASAAVIAITIGWSTSASASEPFLAEIKMFASNFAPRGYALCDGQLLSISSNTALFSILGTTYGGDGRTSFGLPDLRGRTAVHPGRGPGLSDRRLGERWGVESHVMSVAQMPAHTHNATTDVTIKGTNAQGDSETPGGNVMALENRDDGYSTLAASEPIVDMNTQSASATTTITNAGSGQSFGISQPSLGINHIIALVGLFPSRN